MVELQVVQGPYVIDGDDAPRIPIPSGAERLTVLVALRGPIRRKAAAALLWPTVSWQRGAGNLRSAIWRLRAARLELITDVDGRLCLRPEVAVDVRALEGQTSGGVAGTHPLPFLVEALNLLPGWYDDWLEADRERIRAGALDALDRLSDRLRCAGRCAQAIDAALVAVTADPLRDSSQIALVRAYLEEGNLVEARRAYRAYRVQLGAELGSGPSAELVRMITAAG